jgi:putative transposase
MECALAWLGQYRRISKDYDRLAERGETLVYVAVTRFMVRRLSRA